MPVEKNIQSDPPAHANALFTQWCDKPDVFDTRAYARAWKPRVSNT
jgi:hypothetical protein